MKVVENAWCKAWKSGVFEKSFLGWSDLPIKVNSKVMKSLAIIR